MRCHGFRARTYVHKEPGLLTDALSPDADILPYAGAREQGSSQSDRPPAADGAVTPHPTGERLHERRPPSHTNQPGVTCRHTQTRRHRPSSGQGSPTSGDSRRDTETANVHVHVHFHVHVHVHAGRSPPHSTQSHVADTPRLTYRGR